MFTLWLSCLLHLCVCVCVCVCVWVGVGMFVSLASVRKRCKNKIFVLTDFCGLSLFLPPSFCLCLSLSVCLSSLSLSLSASVSLPLSVFLSVCLSVCLSLSLSLPPPSCLSSYYSIRTSDFYWCATH